MNNLLWRAAYVTRGSNFDKIGMAAHIILSSMMNINRQFKIDHVVVCYDGFSWRKSHDPSYKLNRKVTEQARTRDEQEFADMLYALNTDLREFFENNTNVTVLKNDMLEADDLIAGWTRIHDDEEHIIYSSDKDFLQLISKNVSIYDGMSGTTYTIENTYMDGKPKLDKNKKPVGAIDPEYFLFEKIIRGDTSDNIKPAYPGIRKKGSSKRVGIIEAFEDRHHKGFAWNNFMNATWSNENGEDVLVKDAFEHNKLLIALDQQPDYVNDSIAITIANSYDKPERSQVGIKFLKFCNKYNLVSLAESANAIASILNKGNKQYI
jgi:5'-3' exonuclease